MLFLSYLWRKETAVLMTSAMAIFAVFVVIVHPYFEVIYHIGIMALLCLNGWVIQRVGRVGRSRLELLLIFIDLFLMTLGWLGRTR